jgi:predicted RND superfamily exporter protein
MYSTGLTPIINETQLLLLRDLGSSFLMAFALITPMMMLITRSLTVGLLAMIPNVLPIALVFGAMGWLSVPIDIAGILTASIALGIAVDDTCHLISWHAASRRSGHDTESALRYSFNHCATAMLQTTMISCAAMLPFFFAEFIPTRRFAILMVCMLCGAILGDLIFLPALLSLSDRWLGRRARSRA